MKFGAVGSIDVGDLSFSVISAFFHWSIIEETKQLYPNFSIYGASLLWLKENGNTFPYIQSDIAESSIFSMAEFSRCVNIKYSLTSLPMRRNTGLLWGAPGFRSIHHGVVEFSTNQDGALHASIKIEDEWLVKEMYPGFEGHISINASVGYCGLEIYKTSDRSLYENILGGFEYKYYFVSQADKCGESYLLSPFEWCGKHNTPYMLPLGQVVAAVDVLDVIFGR